MEIIGRFPTEKESKDLKISPDTAVWLSASSSEMEPEVINKMKLLRELSIKMFLDSRDSITNLSILAKNGQPIRRTVSIGFS